jgi:hypothetical protein
MSKCPALISAPTPLARILASQTAPAPKPLSISPRLRRGSPKRPTHRPRSDRTQAIPQTSEYHKIQKYRHRSLAPSRAITKNLTPDLAYPNDLKSKIKYNAVHNPVMRRNKLNAEIALRSSPAFKPVIEITRAPGTGETPVPRTYFTIPLNYPTNQYDPLSSPSEHQPS